MSQEEVKKCDACNGKGKNTRGQRCLDCNGAGIVETDIDEDFEDGFEDEPDAEQEIAEI